MVERHFEHDETIGAMPAGVLSIDLAALRANYAQLRQRAGRPVAAVLKANAYGLGATRVSEALVREGCRDFCVAHLEEGLRLREGLSADNRIFVLNGILPGGERAAFEGDLVPVINAIDQLERWSNLSASLGRRLPAVIQLDTGMSRLGLAPDDWAQAAEMVGAGDAITLLYIMSHLASADLQGDAQNGAQQAEMARAQRFFPGAALCFANSGGIFLGEAFAGDMVRSGIALYGGAPMSDRPNPMRAVVRLDVAVIQTRRVAAGTRIGYGGAHVARGEMRLATIAAGYADGLPRSLSDRGAVYFDGQRLPIVGRVSMDSMVIDISSLPLNALGPGSVVEIIGPHQTIDDLAGDADTISYEILTGLGARFVRRYSGEDGVTVSEAS